MRALAFYLPQYHPIPENDEWWGAGFTEWRNVTRARALFPGHYQPHLPGDLGFYDLRLAEVRQAQADLAQAHGINGFVYYHYWFNGRRILERPFAEVLNSGKPDFPFCLCWANENWTRVWDGGTKNILLEQQYSAADDLRHIDSLLPAFRDPRYIRIDGRPLLLVYRSELIPDPTNTARIWRRAAIEAGVGDLYIARVEGFERGIDPATIGFDAAVEFAPNWLIGQPKFRTGVAGYLSKAGVLPRAFTDHRVLSYAAVAEASAKSIVAPYKKFRCVTPMWDNSARRRANALILDASTPDLYAAWLSAMAEQTLQTHTGDEQIIFINAWNEWAEGNHLEPDLKWGLAYLQATERVLSGVVARSSAKRTQAEPNAASASAFSRSGGLKPASLFQQRYWATRSWVNRQRDLLGLVFGRGHGS
jgi:lipopolysaccharide biosynthesis protein